MKKILLMSMIALSLVGASGCSNNSNSTNNSSAKSSKTTQKKHWVKKKVHKIVGGTKRAGMEVRAPQDGSRSALGGGEAGALATS